MEYAKLNNAGSREINEDSIDIFREGERMIFVLADGLGGHGGGEIASQKAVETVGKTFAGGGDEPVEKLMREAFQNAHNMLKKMQNEVGNRSFFKTTLVILVVDKDYVIWGHVGDSRIYHFEQGKLIERSMDHSVPQVLASAGKISEKKIRFHEDRNKLTRVLGSEDENSKPFITVREPRNRAASFLLCTDGFWELIDEKHMESALRRSNTTRGWIRSMEERVVKKGKNRDMDNYSAIAVML